MWRFKQRCAVGGHAEREIYVYSYWEKSQPSWSL